MSNCVRCRKEIPADSIFCPYCGKKQITTKAAHTRRGNSTGSVYKLPNGRWRAVVTLGYEDVDGELKRRTRSKEGFKTKKDAQDYLPLLFAVPAAVDSKITFKGLYEKWLPTHKVSKGTLSCYKAAYKHFQPLWYTRVSKIKTSALQACVDSQKGKRTQENMKALATMLWREAMKDDITDRNYAEYITVSGETQGEREAFSADEIRKMWDSVFTAPNIDVVLIMIYTGFRISELLALTGESFHDGEQPYFIGGSKTEAGRNRIVAISPKIYPLIQARLKPGFLFEPRSSSGFRKSVYYPALEAAGVRKLSPHSCRHTFATLMKNVDAPDADKLAMIGHTSMKMTMHYTHSDEESAWNIAKQL